VDFVRPYIAAIALALGLGLSSLDAFAIPKGRQVYGGLQFGAHIPVSNSSIQLGTGLQGGYRFQRDISAGAAFHFATQKINVNGATPAESSNSTSTSLQFSGDLNFHPDRYIGLKDLTVSARLGIYSFGSNTVTDPEGAATEVSSSSIDFFLGPKISWDWLFDFGLGFGAEANVLFRFSGSGPIINLFGTVKFWL
jgi:hypothetical protein